MKSEGPDNQMKLSFAVALFAATTFAAFAQSAMPRMSSAEPQNGKAGEVIVVTGENLQKDAVAKLYLTDGTNDIQVEVSEQTATSLKFKIPAKTKPGRLALMVLTGGKEPKLIEQPVKVTIDE
jgi:IPT/TIG domain